MSSPEGEPSVLDMLLSPNSAYRDLNHFAGLGERKSTVSDL